MIRKESECADWLAKDAEMKKGIGKLIKRVAGRGRALIALMLCGCSLTPGKSLTIFPEGHRLIDTAKEMRQAAPEPLSLPRELDKRVLAAYVIEPGDVLLLQPADFDSPV